jgi:hypothetical protein
MQDGIKSARALVFWHVSFREPPGRQGFVARQLFFAVAFVHFNFQFAFQTIPFFA